MIEAKTMLSMAKTLILPAIENYSTRIAAAAAAKKAVCPDLKLGYEMKVIERLSALMDEIVTYTEELQKAVEEEQHKRTGEEKANHVRDQVKEAMSRLRTPCDEAETIVAKTDWPMPTYADILLSTR